ncbi:MAG: porphobilinogen synthase [Bacteroidota bacterium]
MTYNSNIKRLRRLRSNPVLREMLSEVSVTIDDLIYPIFVEEEITEKVALKSMPGIFRIPENQLEDEVKRVEAAGIKAIVLFGISHHKDEIGGDTLKKDGLVSRMTRIAKNASESMVIITDICFCEYTTHGHCGILDSDHDVDNDKTIVNLGKQAVLAAEAGADIVAPSSMMDGQIREIRKHLDESGYIKTLIMSYSTKFSSSIYGPFREAGGTSLEGDRDKYMLDFRNPTQGILESMIDEEEGADILMIKPGLLYLDMLAKVKANSHKPVCVYNISGEYAMLKFAAMNGAIDYHQSLHEVLIAFKRAGADLIITYSALDWVEHFHNKE